MIPSAHYTTLLVEHHDGLERVSLNRPDSLNAVSLEMAHELTHYFSGLHARPEARVVMLAGQGKHFCAGFDLSQVHLISRSTGDAMRLQRVMSDIVLHMRRCPQPIIALMHGAASGAGFAIGLAADVRYAAHTARMNVAMSRIGLTGCDMGISYILPRTVGMSNAAELMMTGRFADAAHALRIGLVSRVCEPDALERVGLELARDMLAMSPAGLRMTKEGLNVAMDAGGLEAVLAMEDRGQVMTITRYMKEGVAAFREKRAPNYPQGDD